MDEFNRYGNSVRINADNAEEVIALAVEHIRHRSADESRSQAFKECTAYWEKQIRGIHEFGGPPRAQLSRILSLFQIEVKGEDS